MNKLEPAGLEAAVAEIKASFYEADQDDVTVAERIVRAYLSALDVPAHPDGVKAWQDIPVDDTTIDYVLRYGGRCRECADHMGVCPGALPCDSDEAKAAIRHVLRAVNYGMGHGFLPTLSHPEPVAQEAVDRLWDRPIMELAMAKAGHSFDVTAKRGKIRETREAYIASNWSHWREDAIAEVAALSGLAHPSPSPEQGDDLVQRLTEVYEHDWRISFLAHTSDTAREAATELSALRARVAELEARATPQAGASEAEPVAWMRDYPDMTCLTTTKPEPPEPGWRDIWMPLYATPPDSDAVRSAAQRLLSVFDEQAQILQRIVVGGRSDRELREEGNRAIADIRAALSNQGSSSNGQ